MVTDVHAMALYSFSISNRSKRSSGELAFVQNCSICWESVHSASRQEAVMFETSHSISLGLAELLHEEARL